MALSIDTEGTDKPICPYCGYVHRDAYEWRHDEDDVDCDSCGATFEYAREVEVTYSTFVIDEAELKRRAEVKARQDAQMKEFLLRLAEQRAEQAQS